MPFSFASSSPFFMRICSHIYTRLWSQICVFFRCITTLRPPLGREQEGSVLFGFYNCLRNEASSQMQFSGSELWSFTSITNQTKSSFLFSLTLRSSAWLHVEPHLQSGLVNSLRDLEGWAPCHISWCFCRKHYLCWRTSFGVTSNLMTVAQYICSSIILISMSGQRNFIFCLK